MKNETIEFGIVDISKDKDGFENEKIFFEPVMAEIKSVKRSEFYQAARDGIKISLAAVVNVYDLNATQDKKKVKVVKYNNDVFKIVRTYQISKNDIELILQEAE